MLGLLYRTNSSHHGNRVTPNRSRKARPDRRLPRQIASPDLLNDRPGQYVVHVSFVQSSLGDKAGEGQALQVDGQLVGVDGRGEGEGESDAVDYDDVARGGAGGSCGEEARFGKEAREHGEE